MGVTVYHDCTVANCCGIVSIICTWLSLSTNSTMWHDCSIAIYICMYAVVLDTLMTRS